MMMVMSLVILLCAMIMSSFCMLSMPACLFFLLFCQISSLCNCHHPCFCDHCFCLPIPIFHWAFAHYSLPCFFDYCLALCMVLCVHMLGYLCMAYCLYCYYCLCMVISQAILICPLMDLSLYVFVVDLRGIVQLWFVFVLYVVCLRWLDNPFLCML